MLGDIWARGLGLGQAQVQVGVQGSNGLGFSEWVAVLTCLLCPVFSHG